MLKTRIITALALLPIILLALFVFPRWAWTLFALFIAMLACWEWSRMCGLGSTGRRGFLLLSLLVAGMILIAFLAGGGFPFERLATGAFLIAVAFWLLAAPLWLARNWRPGSAWLAAGVGWIVIFPTAIALLVLHQPSPWVLLSFAAIVWVADISAYFVGKAFGRHKLAPSISPGKTIEGVAGGISGVAIYFFAWRALTASPGSPLALADTAWAAGLRAQGLWLLLVFLLLACISVLGDLFESWMKRGAGLKDSSALLPGHGGILDRIDALTSTLPLAALYVMLMPAP
jgi:phosphatidate cytidylyltransferase